MRVMTVIELLRLTRRELCELSTLTTADLARHPEGSVEHANAPTNLRATLARSWRGEISRRKALCMGGLGAPPALSSANLGIPTLPSGRDTKNIAGTLAKRE